MNEKDNVDIKHCYFL